VTRAAAAVLLVAGLATGCAKETATEQAQGEPAETGGGGEPIRLDVSVEKREVGLGEDVLFHVKLTNTWKSRVTVNVPRLDLRSLSVQVVTPDGSKATVTRNHSEIDFQRGQFRPEPGETKELGQGESVEKDVTVVAMQVGKTSYTPTYTYQGAIQPLVSPTFEVNVTPTDPQKTRLGVHLETTEGPYTAVFRPDVAYNTCESFAANVKSGFYNGLKLHRIIRNFMAQGGDPKGTGEGGPGYYIPFEGANPPKLPHKRGVMSMARTGLPTIGKDTGGSQFFILFATRTDLDRGGYATFAEMVEGDDTLKKLENVPVKQDPRDPNAAPPITPVLMRQASLVSVP
jgi:cyclophilin family peptidyl-prolyl cis-trans isomerase